MQTRVLFMVALMMGVAFAGCVGGDGSASVYIRDAPTDEFESVNITFTHVYVHEAGDDEDEENDTDQDGGQQAGDDGAPGGTLSLQEAAQHDERDGDGQGDEQFQEDAGWFAITEDEDGIEVDLLNATGTHAAFLGEGGLPAGHYTHIAVVIQDAYGIDTDGDRVDIRTPSNIGRVVQSFDVQEDTETRIILDLDLDRALVEQGSGWALTPVWGQTVTEHVDPSTSGSEEHEPGEVAEVE